MSGDWMKVELELPDKPEVFRIASILNLDPDAVVGKLLRVWAWFDKHTESGNADSVTFALVDRISGVTGFGEAMAFAGWLVQEAHSLSVPNFDRHNGKTAKNRALTAKRVAHSKEKSNAKGNAPIVTTALPREEKRREEEKQEIAVADAPAPASKKASAVELDTWLATLGDELPIRADDPIFAYAAKVGLPLEFLELSWHQFCESMRVKRKRQANWRQHYRNHVQGNWGRLWAINRQGEYFLTTEGEQARRALA